MNYVPLDLSGFLHGLHDGMSYSCVNMLPKRVWNTSEESVKLWAGKIDNQIYGSVDTEREREREGEKSQNIETAINKDFSFI